MTDPVTPRTPDEITATWLTQAFAAGRSLPDANVKSIRLEPIGEDLGFTATIVRAHLGFDVKHPDLPGTCIVKMPSTDPEVRLAALLADVFGRENRFYQNYPENGPGRPPKHYYSVADPENDDFILIMEDLAGARFVGQEEGAGRDDALSIVGALGQIHSRFWTAPDTESLNWLPPLSDVGALLQMTFEAGTPALLENYGDHIPGDMRDALQALDPGYMDIISEAMERPTTLMHGDARIENFAFEPGSGPECVRLFDWAGAIRGSGAYDFTYFLATSMDPETRRELEGELIAAYLAELGAGGVTGYEAADLRSDMSLSLATMIGVISYWGTLIKPDEAGKSLMGTMLPRMIESIRDHDGIAALKSFQKD